jgi:[ribosomal protein S5]-alanine N-acetyltransferase
VKYDTTNKTITTERLILRLFSKADAENVSNLCNNYNLYKSTLHLPYPYTIEHALTWIGAHRSNFDNDKQFEFAITDKTTGELYGCIGLSHNTTHRNGEIGYWLGEQFWRNGYATEAAKAMIEFAFDEKGYHKVYAKHFASNPASGRVMQKCGMKYEGELVDQIYKNNVFINMIQYGIINPRE